MGALARRNGVTLRSLVLACAAVVLAVAAAPAGGDPQQAPAGLPPTPAGDAGDCADRVAARVQAHYDGVDDLAASFVQRTRSVVFGGAAAGEASEARGEVVFAKPGRMRWRYTSPEPSLVVSNGKLLWIYDPTADEAQELAVGEAFLSGTAIQFLLGEGELSESFEVGARGCGEAAVTLELLPREPASYEKLELVVSAETGALRETHIFDLFGNQTHVTFESLRTNTKPEAELFTFQPGPQTRMLRLPAAQ